jgi:hypothetical protein
MAPAMARKAPPPRFTNANPGRDQPDDESADQVAGEIQDALHYELQIDRRILADDEVSDHASQKQLDRDENDHAQDDPFHREVLVRWFGHEAVFFARKIAILSVFQACWGGLLCR